MKLILKKSALLLTGIFAAGSLFAQTTDTMHMSSDYVKPFSGNKNYKTWSIGISGGALSTLNAFQAKNRLDFVLPNAEVGYSAFVKYQVTPAVGFQVDYLGGQLSANRAQPNAAGVVPYNSFTTKIHYALSASTNITVGNISWKNNKSAIQPYLTIGAGDINYTPVLSIASTGAQQNFNSTGSGTINELFVPLGAGIKFDIGHGVNLDLGYQVNFVYSDNIDGYNYGATNDKFSYAHVGLEFALGSKSKPQLATHNPVSSMRHEYMWENQATRSELQLQINTAQAAIDAEKARSMQLRNDLNATNAALARFTTDSDNDGVPDFLDKCPGTPAGTKVDGSGCPLPVNKPDVKIYVTEEDKKVVNEAVKNLEFDFGKATIREHSNESLNRLAELLAAKHFNLKLAGYTDNVGSAAANLKLSKERAESVKNYLVSKGADAARVTALGYGKADPIATNKTDAGRQKNRRVEFTLF